MLQGLTYQATAAIIAAPTTSLPEAVGGERNWDYRFAWIRDASFTLDALWVAACRDEARAFLDYLTTVASTFHESQELQIMFGIRGEHDLSVTGPSHRPGAGVGNGGHGGVGRSRQARRAGPEVLQLEASGGGPARVPRRGARRAPCGRDAGRVDAHRAEWWLVAVWATFINRILKPTVQKRYQPCSNGHSCTAWASLRGLIARDVHPKTIEQRLGDLSIVVWDPTGIWSPLDDALTERLDAIYRAADQDHEDDRKQ